MSRRRRKSLESGFSLDSFLDLVTNVVGIIIRLIVVAWVGARGYTTISPLLSPAPPAQTSPLPPVDDLAMRQQLARERAELAEAEARLLEQLRNLDLVKHEQGAVAQELAALTPRAAALAEATQRLDQVKTAGADSLKETAQAMSDLEKRREKLKQELKELEKDQPTTKTLRFQTPVSQTVRGEELHFECRRDRVAFVDLGQLLPQVRRALRDHQDTLKTQWEVTDVTEPVGAFQLRYVIERQRGNLDAVVADSNPDPYASFSYGVTEWVAVPVLPERGELPEAALAAGSDFRHAIDGLEAQNTAITLWVYPDSFGLYRQLRDYLTEKGFTVAGRPLMDDRPIAGSSRYGTRSRGQ
ncbi:MAG: hypothetical protein JNM56_27125 [Planctomycetia bacterium]|nr:hypothetical protein [Planctomycetia bacterium]